MLANGAGADTIDVSYQGLSASAQIVVGSCRYSLSPSNQVVDFGGGTVSLEVTAGSGCAWTATSTSSWLAATSGNRVVDTRNPNGPLGGPQLVGGVAWSFPIPNGCNIPADAGAYSLNVTVVPDHALSYLSIWPSGRTQPLVSTLNSDGRVKANAAIVAAGSDGAINVYASDATHVILDIDGYFVTPGSSTLAFYP